MATHEALAILCESHQAHDKALHASGGCLCNHAALSSVTLWLADRVAQPLFIVNDRGVVLLTNEGARRVLKSSRDLTIAKSRLVFTNLSQQRIFDTVLEDCLCLLQSLPIIGPTFLGSLTPISCHSHRIASFSISAAPGRGATSSKLQTAFSLTTAEAQIALRIYGGLSLKRIAKERNASINTVKTQTRNVYEKCHVASAATLVRRIGEVLLQRSFSNQSFFPSPPSNHRRDSGVQAK